MNLRLPLTGLITRVLFLQNHGDKTILSAVFPELNGKSSWPLLYLHITKDNQYNILIVFGII